MSHSLIDLSNQIQRLLACRKSEQWLELYDQILCHLGREFKKLAELDSQTSVFASTVREVVNVHKHLLVKKELDRIDSLWAGRFRDFHLHLRLVQALDGLRRTNGEKGTIFDSCFLSVSTKTQPKPTDASDLVRLFMEGHLWIPVEVELYSLFFLLSQHNFCHHWYLWIKPQLQVCNDARATSLKDISPDSFYSLVIMALMGHIKNKAIIDDGQEPENASANTFHIYLFKETVCRSMELRSRSKAALQSRMSATAPRESRRSIIVQEQNVDDLPKVHHPLRESWVQERINNHSWKLIEPSGDPGEFEVVRLKLHRPESDQEELVGLIIYNAMTNEVWKQLKLHHADLIGSQPATRRSDKKKPVMTVSVPILNTEEDMNNISIPHPEKVTIDFRPSGHKLVAAGRRVPQGGARGDTFSHYAWMNASTRQDRERLFMVAHDTSCMLNGIRLNDNNTRAFFQRIHATGHLEPGSGLGSYDHALFYVRQDMHNQHMDKDSGWTVALTLQKEARGLEGSFAFSQYGVVLRQVSNTLFIFDSGRIHGSVFPIVDDEKGVEKPDWSEGHDNQGIVTVLRKKDRDAAESRHQHQHLRDEFWEAYESQ